jgi:Zn finger protein HypA/HybF involved in hydrogenase expression
MHGIDPYSPDEPVYECQHCGNRTESSDHLTVCPNCDGEVRNIAIPRE